jgi:prepilin-type N-terminal cleavage/methylation domain-containing protein
MAMLRKRIGFTLVEILISILILGVVMSAVMTLFFSVFESYQFHQDISEAKQRGHIALASIQPFVSGAALGLPAEKADFQNGFSANPPLFLLDDASPNTKFSSPVQLASGDLVVSDDATKGTALWLVYGEPSGFGVETDYEVDSTPRQIELTGVLNVEANEKTTKSWIVFPAGIAPLFISAIDSGDGKILSVASNKAQKINAFEEAHYLRAVKITVASDDILRIERSDGSGAQPVIEGIERLWCVFDRDGDRVLQVTVLARGDTEHTSDMQSSIEGWPAEAPQPTNRRYRYAAVTRSWRIRN